MFLKDQNLIVQKKNLKMKKVSFPKEIRYKTNNEISSLSPMKEHPDEHHYEFFNEQYGWKMRNFRAKFFKNLQEIDKKKVQRTVIELMYTQLNDSMGDDPIPKLYRENQLRWCSLMMNNPELQQFSVNMVDQLSKIMKKELHHNRDIFDIYMNQPRPQMTQQTKKRFGGSLTQRQCSNRDQELTGILYPSMHDEKSFLSREKQVTNQIIKEGIKFNYRQLQKDKISRKQRLCGMQKHLQQDGKSVAQAAKDQLDDRNQLKKKLEQEFLMAKKGREKSKKILDHKAKGPVLNEFQIEVLKKTKEIDLMIENIDMNNTDLRNEVDDTQNALDQLENERVPGSHHIIPGNKIKDLMDSWGKEEVWYDDDIAKWSSELWMSLQEFERHLNSQESGFKQYHEKMMKKHRNQMQRYKNVTQMKIEALESALIETKLKLLSEREQQSMHIAELESSLLNMQPIQKNVDELVRKCQTGLVIKNMAEAKDIIKKFVTTVKKKDHQVETLNQKIKINLKMIDALEQKVDIKQTYYEEEVKLRRYYQGITLKAVRELKLFEHDEEKQQQFETSIIETEDDLNYQRHIFFLLEKIGLRDAFIDHVNKHYGLIEGVNKIEQNLNLLELVQDGGGGETKLSQSSSQKSKLSRMSGLRSGGRGPMRNLKVSKTNIGGDKSASKTPGFKGLKSLDRKGSLHGESLLNKRPASRADSIGSGTQMSEMKIKKPRGGRKKIGNKSSQRPGSRPTSQAYSSQNEKAEREFQQAAREAAKKQMMALIKDALEGKLDTLVSTNESGMCTADYNVARQQMTDIIRVILPEELENNTFLYDKDDDQPRKKKRKAKKEPVAEKKQTKKKNPAALKKVTTKKIKVSDPKESTMNLDQTAKIDTGLDSQEQLSQGSSQKSLYSNFSKNSLAQKSMVKINVNDTSNASIQMNTEQAQGAAGRFARAKFAAEKRTNKNLSIVQELNENIKTFRPCSSNNSISSLSNEDSSSSSISPKSHVGKKQSTMQLKFKGIDRSPNEGPQSHNAYNVSSKFTGQLNKDNFVSVNNNQRIAQKDFNNINTPRRQDGDSNVRKMLGSGSQKSSIGLKKVSKFKGGVSKKNKKKAVLDFEDLDVFTVKQKLETIIQDKYEKVMDYTKLQEQAMKDRFNISVGQSKEIQDIIQTSMNEQLTKDQLENFKISNVNEFSTTVNKILEQQYGFSIINGLVKNGGEGMVIQDDYEADKEKADKIKKVCFGDILQPVIDEEGELLGFQLRAELIPSLFMNNSFDFRQLKKIVKTSIYMNRILSKGQEYEFNVKQVNGEKQISLTPIEIPGVETQVTEKDIIEEMKLQMEMEAEEEEEQTNIKGGKVAKVDPAKTVLGLLKNHLIIVVSRMAPQKMTYLKMIWENMDFKMLLKQDMENVFVDSKGEKNKENLSFSSYLATVLDKLSSKINKIEYKHDKQYLKVDKLFATRQLQQLTSKVFDPTLASQKEAVETFDRSTQVKIKYRDGETNTTEFNIKGLGVPLKATDSMIIKRSKNQLILDKAIEGEFLQTMKIFDDFVEYMAKLDQRILLAVKSQEVSTYREQQQVEPNADGDPMKVLIKVNDQVTEKPAVSLDDLSNMREQLKQSVNILKDDAKKYNRLIGFQVKSFDSRRSKERNDLIMNQDLLIDSVMNTPRNNPDQGSISPQAQELSNHLFLNLSMSAQRRQKTAIEIKKKLTNENIKKYVVKDNQQEFGLEPQNFRYADPQHIRTALQSQRKKKIVTNPLSDQHSQGVKEVNQSTDLESFTIKPTTNKNSNYMAKIRAIDHQSSFDNQNSSQMTMQGQRFNEMQNDVYIKNMTRNLQSASTKYNEDLPQLRQFNNTSLDIDHGLTRNLIQTSRRGLFSQQNSQENSPLPQELAHKPMKHKQFKWTNKELAVQFDRLSKKMKAKPDPVKGKINKLFKEQEASKVTKWDQMNKRYETFERPQISNRPMTKQTNVQKVNLSLDFGNRHLRPNIKSPQLSNLNHSVNLSQIQGDFKPKKVISPHLNMQTIQQFNDFKEIKTGIKRQQLDVNLRRKQFGMDKHVTIENIEHTQSKHNSSHLEITKDEMSNPISPKGVRVQRKGQKIEEESVQSSAKKNKRSVVTLNDDKDE